MDDLTPETLAETERLIYAHKFPVEKVATTILDLIAAVRAEKAAREADLTACRSPYWREKYEIEKARADKAEQERDEAREQREVSRYAQSRALRSKEAAEAAYAALVAKHRGDAA